MDRYELMRRANLLYDHKIIAAITLSNCVSGLFPCSEPAVERFIKRYKAYCKALDYLQDLIYVRS